MLMLPNWLAIILIIGSIVGGFCYGKLWGARDSLDSFKRGYDVGHANGLKHYAMGSRSPESEKSEP